MVPRHHFENFRTEPPQPRIFDHRGRLYGQPALYLVERDSRVTMLSLGTDSRAALGVETSFVLDDANRRWHGAAAGAWMASSASGGTALPHEQQLLASRVEDSSLSGPDFGVATLLFGRPEHLELRRASVRGSLGASEFKVTFNDSGLNVGNLTAPVDAARLRSLLTDAHVNMIEWPVCDCAYEHWKLGSSCSAMYGYEGLVRFLDATRDFRVAGRQFRLWMLLLWRGTARAATPRRRSGSLRTVAATRSPLAASACEVPTHRRKRPTPCSRARKPETGTTAS